MSKLSAPQINLLLAKMDGLNADTLLRLQKEVEIRITKNKLNDIVADLIKKTKKINSMEWEELDTLLEEFEKNPLIKKHKGDFKDLSIFYEVFDLICGIASLDADASENVAELDDLETMYNDTITALDLILKFDKMSKEFVNPIKIPSIWNSWLKKRLSGMEADGRLLKKGKKKYTKKNKSNSSKRSKKSRR